MTETARYMAEIKGHLLIVTNKKVIFVNSECEFTELKPEHHNGRICYRIPKTTFRIGKRTIKKNLKPCNVIINEHGST